MSGRELSGLAPSDRFVVYETKYWQVNQRADATLPGYLMVGAKDPNALELASLSSGAWMELGSVLRSVTAALVGWLVKTRRFGIRAYRRRQSQAATPER